jgi:3-isopropylmalate dehydrogenase
VTADVAISLRRITRHCCERIARAGFELAMRRRKRVTIVHKANVLKIGDGMFIDECRKVGARFPEVAIDDVIVDAMMAHVVRDPRRFDVIVTTNMFGDILSDLTAELLLDWYGRRAKQPAFHDAAAAIEQAAAKAMATNQVTRDVGGTLGTRDTGRALAALVEAA